MRAVLRRAAVPLLAVGAVLLVLAVAAGLRLRSVERNLRDANALIDEADEALDQDRVADARAALVAAQVLLTDANGDLYGRLELDAIEMLPVVSQNISTLRESVGLALVMVDGGRRILGEAAVLEREDGSIEVPLESGAIPLDAVVAAQREIDALASALPGPDERTEPRFLLPELAEVRRDLLQEASRRRAQLDILARGLAVLADMAGGDGDRRYLIAVANTAEMRGTGGMILNYGVLEGRSGDFELSAFGRIDELLLDEPVPVDTTGLPDDYLSRWEGFDVRQRWRNANVAADFTLVAPVLEEMYAAATGQTADGVIQIDPHGLAAIMEGTGPVEVAGLGTIDAGNVVELTLNSAYRLFPDIETRSDVLGDVAEAVFTELLEGRYDSMRPLADALVGAVDGRHVLVHADQRVVQRQSRFFGADGGFPDQETVESMVLTVQNTNATKLDYYVDTALAIEGTRPSDDVGTLLATVTLTNGAPPGERVPRYIFGPSQAGGVPGRYRGTVSLYVPRGTTLTGWDGPSVTAPSLFSEDGRAVISYVAEVDAGASTAMKLALTLPPPSTPSPWLVLLPTPRVRPTTADVDVSVGGRRIGGSVTLDRPFALSPGRAPLSLSWGLATANRRG